MLKLNYFFHLVLNSKHLIIIKLFIIFLIYLFNVYWSSNLSFCMLSNQPSEEDLNASIAAFNTGTYPRIVYGIYQGKVKVLCELSPGNFFYSYTGSVSNSELIKNLFGSSESIESLQIDGIRYIEYPNTQVLQTLYNRNSSLVDYDSDSDHPDR